MKKPKSLESKKIKGDSKEFFTSLAPLILSSVVAKQFNHLAVTTSKEHEWVLILDEKNICGFCCIEPANNFKVRYIYVASDYEHGVILTCLIQSIVSYFELSEYNTCKTIVSLDDLDKWKRQGFSVDKKSKNWANLKINKSNKTTKN
jgi:hypothetical protein